MASFSAATNVVAGRFALVYSGSAGIPVEDKAPGDMSDFKVP